MTYLLTPAARRAIATAAAWTTRDDCAEIELPELLLGLLAEPESRAAILLAASGVDAGQVVRRWPRLTRRDERQGQIEPGAAASLASAVASVEAATELEPRYSTALRGALDWAKERLWEFPQPLELATEHLLLGIAGNGGETAHWLLEQGLGAAQIEAEIYRANGHLPGPLDWSDGAASPSGSRQASAPSDFVDDLNDRSRGLARSDAESSEVWRILDAAANRAAEGMRVVEDYLRFALDDRHLTYVAKQLRHQLAAAVARLPAEARLGARDTRSDVGATISTSGERSRDDLGHVALANLKRVQQSLRSLEEHSKLVDAETSDGFERLRYETYTLERAIGIGDDSRRRLGAARLYALVDGRDSEQAFSELVTALIEAGVDLIQLRDKQLGDRERLARARLLVSATRGTATLSIINDRPDLAALAGADGVHVGQSELSVKDARSIVGPRSLIGVSTHSIEQAEAAVLDGASYLGVGPIFASRTKSFQSFPGLEFARQVAERIRLPAFAIGGIASENLPLLLATGIRRIAVSDAITSAADPAAAARRLRCALAAAVAG